MFKRRSLTPSSDNPLMASAHHHSQSGFSHLPPQMQSEFKLPSLKDLNFQYHSVVPGSSQDAPPLSAAASTSSDHGSQSYSSSRRDWSRPASATTSINPSSSHSQLSPQVSIHEQQSQQPPPQKQLSYSSYNHDPTYFPSPMVPPSHTSSGSQNPRDDAPNPNKRPRSAPNTITNSPAHSPHSAYPSSHAPYPPSQHTGPSFHQHPHPAPPPHDQVHHPPPYHGGYPYLSPYGQHRQPPHMPPPPHAHHQMAPVGYPQPPHWHPVPPPLQHPPQHPYPGHPSQFSGGYRTTPLVPTNLDARAAYPPPPPNSEVMAKTNLRQNIISEIANNCRILYDFASRYAQMQAGVRYVQPRKDELAEMAQRAANIVRLLEDLRRVVLPDHAASSADKNGIGNGNGVNGDDYRPPKRPWEEISKEVGESVQSPVEGSVSKRSTKSDKSSPGQSLAEKDMDLIRSKRATTTGNSATGQQKSKYRKRSRASPPGKCHSCNIRETPEWRRGPDGARTLCNACGLHYAKLVRKREKQPDGKPAPIDLQTLRACTAQVRGGLPFPDSPLQENIPQPTGNGNELSGAGYRAQDDPVSATVEAGSKSYSQNPKEEHPGNLSPTSHPTSQSLPSMMSSANSLPPVPPPWVSRGSEGSFGSRRSPFSG